MKKQLLFIILILFSAQICAMEEAQVLDVKKTEAHQLTKSEKLAWQLVMHYCFDEKDYKGVMLIVKIGVNPAKSFIEGIHNGPLLVDEVYNDNIGVMSYILYKVAHEIDNKVIKQQLHDHKCLPHAFTYANLMRDGDLPQAIEKEPDFVKQYKAHIKAGFILMNYNRIQEGKEPFTVESLKQHVGISGPMFGLDD